VDLARTLRSQAGIRVRQPLARVWLALPGGELAARDELIQLLRDEINVREVILIGDESGLVERRVKPLLPKIGRKHGAAIPAIMAAARGNTVEYHADGSVTLGGVTLAPDEVEILASPRPGTAVAHDEGLVVVIDTELTDDLRAEGDARELQRAIQDLRKDAGLDLDDRIELWVDGLPEAIAVFLDGVAAETLAAGVERGAGPTGPRVTSGSVELTGGAVAIAIRRIGGDS
jgi:isoleucyl-tRNA synthetase